MSAATDTHPQTGVPEISIDRIDVAEGHNPRQRFEEAELAELEASIAEHGVVQAITVRSSDEEGRFVLVAGERRLVAAKRAGLSEIPALVREGKGALGAAVAENLTRADLDVIEEAEAVRRLAELEDLDQAALAKRIGKSRSWASERLRLLKLPEGCREGFASGELPLAAERPLRAIARVSAEVAEALVAQTVADGQGELMLSDLASALYALAGAIEDRGDPEGPTLISLNHRGLSGELIADDAERAELAERWRAALKRLGYGSGLGDDDELWVSVSEEHIDAARAAGVLLEVETDTEWQADHYFLVDGEFGADLVRRGVEDAERRATERKVAEAKSPHEVLEVIADAMIAASYADEREVAQTHRVQFWNRAITDAVGEELGADVKEVKIKRAPGS